MELKICMVGPMLGRNKGWVTTQGEILADLFRLSGYQVIETSRIINRFFRLIDTVFTIVRWKNKYDMAIISVFSGPAFYMADISSFILKIIGKPTILVLRGGNLPGFAEHRKRWIKRVLQRADVVVSPSAYLGKFCAEYFIDVKIIPNIIFLENYKFKKREHIKPNLLWMRTFHPIYNPEMAIEVVEKVIKTVPEARLTMAGQEKGSLLNVKSLTNQKKLQKVVNFIGFLKQKEKQNVFNANDIYLHTNKIDNTPVSVLEAAAYGLPIIATRVGGIPDLLEDEVTCLMVEDGDIDAMSQAVIRLTKNPQLVGKLSENGRKLAESCSWEKVKPQWEDAFIQCLNKNQ